MNLTATKGAHPMPVPKPAFKLGRKDADFYRENGYLVVEEALDSDEVERLRKETAALCRGDYGDVRGASPAAPGEGDDGLLRRHLCIHFPHKRSKIMSEALAHPVVREVLTQVVGPNIKAMQSMLFIKSAGKPGQAWHQDEDYIPTRDRSLTGGWIALDKANVENGCLWVIPGSHRDGVLYPQKWHADPRFDCALEAYEFPYKDVEAVPVEVPAGAIVFFNGYLLHRSLPNRAKAGYRRCLVNHHMSAESLLPWFGFKDGLNLATADYRDIVMITGKDPYAYKGTQEIASTHVRSTGEGGCGENRYNVDPLRRQSTQG